MDEEDDVLDALVQSVGVGVGSRDGSRSSANRGEESAQAVKLRVGGLDTAPPFGGDQAPSAQVSQKQTSSFSTASAAAASSVVPTSSSKKTQPPWNNSSKPLFPVPYQPLDSHASHGAPPTNLSSNPTVPLPLHRPLPHVPMQQNPHPPPSSTHNSAAVHPFPTGGVPLSTSSAASSSNSSASIAVQPPPPNAAYKPSSQQPSSTPYYYGSAAGGGVALDPIVHDADAAAPGAAAAAGGEGSDAAGGSQSNMLVCVRVRPLMSHDRTQKEVTRVLDRRVIVILDPNKVNDAADILRANRSREKRYAFDRVFQMGEDNAAVYRNTTAGLLSGVLDGYNATVFAYGNTGAGKTHTMIGSVEEPGIMVLTLQDLFKLSEEHGIRHGAKFRVTVSFIEVYNENIRDLLTESEDVLDLREDPIKGPVISGVREVETNSSEEIMDLLHQGNRNRTQQATAANAVSSRSHAVLQVVVENRDRAEGTVARIKIGKLSLVDLAGSERAAATKNQGIRLTEGANINRSLLALGNCINALGEKANKGQFVPYRDSKLTRLLKDSLGGNCRTVMIANISSAVSNFEETLNTLKYANRAKNIKTSVTRNELSVNHHISEYVNLITDLRSEINNLKSQLTMPTVADRHVAPSGGGGGSDGAAEAVMEEARVKIVDNFKEKMQLRRSLIELEDQNVSNSIEVGKRQILIAEWNDARGQTPKSNGRKKGAAGVGADDMLAALQQPSSPREEEVFSTEFIESFAPQDVKDAWDEVLLLRKAIEKNNATKRAIAKRLRMNEKQAEKFRQELLTKITGQDRKQLMELQYRIGKLELDNMELEQSRIVHDSMMKGKDLTIQKLQLQLAVRDKVLAQQRAVLVANGLDHLIGYTGLEIMQQAAITDNFDTLRLPASSGGGRRFPVVVAAPAPPAAASALQSSDDDDAGSGSAVAPSDAAEPSYYNSGRGAAAGGAGGAGRASQRPTNAGNRRRVVKQRSSAAGEASPYTVPQTLVEIVGGGISGISISGRPPAAGGPSARMERGGLEKVLSQQAEGGREGREGAHHQRHRPYEQVAAPQDVIIIGGGVGGAGGGGNQALSGAPVYKNSSSNDERGGAGGNNENDAAALARARAERIKKRQQAYAAPVGPQDRVQTVQRAQQQQLLQQQQQQQQLLIQQQQQIQQQITNRLNALAMLSSPAAQLPPQGGGSSNNSQQHLYESPTQQPQDGQYGGASSGMSAPRPKRVGQAGLVPPPHADALEQLNDTPAYVQSFSPTAVSYPGS